MNTPIRRRHFDEPFVCIMCGPHDHGLALIILGEVLICHRCVSVTLYLGEGELLCDGCVPLSEPG